MRANRILVVLVGLMPLAAAAQSVQDIAEPFKVGTFEMAGSPAVGIVLRDSIIIELDAANAALEKMPVTRVYQCPPTCWN